MSTIRPVATLQMLAVLASLAIVSAGSAAAGPLHIALLSNVAVDTDTILLAQLLPLGAPQKLQSTAQHISLGAAPQLGFERQLGRSAITQAMAAAGLSPTQFAVPAIVTIRREDRFIGLPEIFAAVESALQNTPDLPNGSQITPADLHTETQIAAPPGYSGLEVIQATFDPGIQRMRFRVLPKAPGRTLPFFVTADLRSTFVASASSQPQIQLASTRSPAASRPAPDAAPLVTTGHPARLHLHSPDMEMILAVSPLQRGYLDQVIRVRLFGTATTMRARVVGPGYLDATL